MPRRADEASPSRDRGQDFEAIAERYLRKRGLQLILRNYSCRGGELDLIMQDGPTVVFIEVRFRSSQRFGGAIGSVDQKKQARIIVAANHFLMTHSQFADRACRFDVVGIHGEGKAQTVDWITGAFSA
jgi:putative endonuclease